MFQDIGRCERCQFLVLLIILNKTSTHGSTLSFPIHSQTHTKKERMREKNVVVLFLISSNGLSLSLSIYAFTFYLNKFYCYLLLIHSVYLVFSCHHNLPFLVHTHIPTLFYLFMFFLIICSTSIMEGKKKSLK